MKLLMGLRDRFTIHNLRRGRSLETLVPISQENDALLRVITCSDSPHIFASGPDFRGCPPELEPAPVFRLMWRQL